ncbi:MAG: FliI/YscN family ATPase [Planctomycetes bacterium]|nr:FliI/YscN family ATPase [Planctomycetota bacterium]MCB9909981.1 FliI/YscN family ATPase [Planctomycetota bacterium]HPF12715.1 FliI/YscN family ATPase [Planctomycetota bacterium]
MSGLLDFARCQRIVQDGARPRFRGSVDRVTGILVEALGIPAALGDMCRIEMNRNQVIEAEVVGFRGLVTLLMPHGDLAGIAPGQPVYALERPFQIPVGPSLLGRMLDGFGRAHDGGPELHEATWRRVHNPAPAPQDRVPIRSVLQTGVRVIDGLIPLGLGQRLGVFAGSGVGKSTLLGQVTRGTEADVIVCCLVGERGREVQDFVEEVLGPEGMERAVLVVATSDRPPIERLTAPFAAVTIAEYFRDQGKNVLLLMDSITRYAAAAREVGLAIGEPPTVRGLPPSFFATVPQIVERMGRTQKGSITGLISVLVDGDDPNEPVADTLRGLLDGHIFLSREMAQAGHFPAVDVLGSLSRLAPALCSREQLAHAQAIRNDLATYKEGKDLVEIGAYQAGSNPALDGALMRMPVVNAFLRQDPHEITPVDETREMMAMVAEAGQGGRA